MEKNNSSIPKAHALAQRLQTIKNDDLEEIRELGSGTYRTVYYGKWKGSDVAIKRIKASCFTGSLSEQERMRGDFWREANILGQLHHPKVVAFYGIVVDGPYGTLATVTKYMVNGSLKQVLNKKDSEEKPIPENRIISWAAEGSILEIGGDATNIGLWLDLIG